VGARRCSSSRLNPVYGLYAATSRQTLTGEPRGGWFPDERLSIEEAIEAATKNPAWASFEEQIKGTITVGKLADLAVFDTNLVEAGRTEPARLLKARVLYTIAGGKVVYERREPFALHREHRLAADGYCAIMGRRG
jgi:predicted amidohydrolase YtcJ